MAEQKNYVIDFENNSDKINRKKLLSLKNLLIILAAVFFINLIYVNIRVLNLSEYSKIQGIPILNRISSISSETKNNSSADKTCSQACMSQIYQATASSGITQNSNPIASPVPSIATPSPTDLRNSAKEFFVPFGSGSSQASDWEKVPGTLATIDTGNYAEFETVTFEATVRIPNGSQMAYIRLYNTTDNIPIFDSEMSWEGGTTQLLISKPLSLSKGKKTYQVQIKTQLKVLTIFDQARLHIITN